MKVSPAQLRVLVTRRPRYACRRCSRAMAQAHTPEHVVPGGLPTEALIAQVMVAKFGDHLPFYRQAEIDRSDPEKRPLRGTRGRSRELGIARQPDRKLQDMRRRSGQISDRHIARIA